MADPKGFLKVERVGPRKRDPGERIHDYNQYFSFPDERTLRDQGGRCMSCGIPFCHEGCPLGNLIPEWNDLVHQGRWREALNRLHATNNFPEFTGLICPAPCESACVLDINDDAVTIEQIEGSIAERGWAEGWIVPDPPDERSGKSVAVVGSGPAGMAVAAELNRFGHQVTVFERDESIGGLMRYGVPDAKLEKWIIDRRVDLLAAEGVEFITGTDVGTDVTTNQLRAQHDAVVIAIGSRVHRDLDAHGRDLGGVHFAMDYLYQRNRYVAASEGRPARETPPDQVISAKDRRVLVVGGGDTGMDCISNALREGAASARMLDVYPELPAQGRPPGTPWPLPPKRTPMTYALEEGGERQFGSQVTEIVGDGSGCVKGIRARQVSGTSSRDVEPVPGSDWEEPADLVLIAIGFTGPETHGPISDIGLATDKRGNIKAGVYESSESGVFACGDARIGQSLVVTAIAEGRKCARMVDRHLGGSGEVRRVTSETMFAIEDGDEHSLRHQAETAGAVTVGDAFWSGPRDE